MTKKLCLAAAALGIAVAPSTQTALAKSRVDAGVLSCDVATGWEFVFGSSHDVNCTFSGNNGAVQRYTGHIDKFGVDLGYLAAGVVIWKVLAPSGTIGKDALAGTYGGVIGGAAVGAEAGADVLVGGSANAISLQPVTIEGMAGLHIAAGIAWIVLEPASK